MLFQCLFFDSEVNSLRGPKLGGVILSCCRLPVACGFWFKAACCLQGYMANSKRQSCTRMFSTSLLTVGNSATSFQTRSDDGQQLWPTRSCGQFHAGKYGVFFSKRIAEHQRETLAAMLVQTSKGCCVLRPHSSQRLLGFTRCQPVCWSFAQGNQPWMGSEAWT